MLKTTSSQFQNNNQIHFRALIRTTSGIPMKVNGEDVRLFEDINVIDLNDDGVPELRQEESFNRLKLQITEPVFTTDLKALYRLGSQYGTEVLRQEDLGRVEIGEPSYDLGKYIWSSPSTSSIKNQRSLDDLVYEMGAFPRSAQWAIDLAHGQFVVYSPKAPAAQAG